MTLNQDIAPETAAALIDEAHSRQSSLREGVLKHRFLGELLGCLWIQGRREVDLLFPAVDYAGYDHVVEWQRITRHTQLKASHSHGKRNEVTINQHLAKKPSGCVIWILFDEKTLRLGPFLWFGGAPGQPLPDLGDKVGRHTKADQQLLKAERPNTRVVPKSRFRRLETIEEVVEALFGAPDGTGRTTERREAAHRALLLRHLRAQARSSPLAADEQAVWLETARRGEFSVIPDTLDWESSAAFAHLIQGIELARQAGLGDFQDFCEAGFAEAVRTGRWRGTALELWVTLLGAHRRIRHGGYDPDEPETRRFNALCRELGERLKTSAPGAA
jgi:hypothetical protein